MRHKEPFPDRDFTLSAFGFPEPEGLSNLPPPVPDVLIPAKPAPTPTSVWVALTAGVCAALFAAVIGIRRRRKPRPPVTP